MCFNIKGKVIKIGNSLGVRIPASYLKEMNLDYGTDIEISYDSSLGCIVISKDQETSEKMFEKRVLDIVSAHLNNLNNSNKG